ncbi:MAG TPA: acylphosphatase [Gemmatimonadaceae bacterium]|nr:acylphosphatase [Gemmatimonadaceae bacterium]
MAVIHLEVTGRVQGVGFRWFVRERARALELAGWVRNRDDGKLEVAAMGSEDALSVLISAVQDGPPGAAVREVVHRQPPQDADYPRPFSVRR